MWCLMYARLPARLFCVGFANDQKDGTFRGFYNSTRAGDLFLHVQAEGEDIKVRALMCACVSAFVSACSSVADTRMHVV